MKTQNTFQMLIFSSLIFYSATSYTAEKQYWNDIVFKASLTGTDGLKIYATQKFTKDVHDFSYWNLAIVPSWKIYDWLTVETEYLYQRLKINKKWMTENRLSLIPTLHWKVGNYSWSARTKFEKRYLSNETKWRIREKIRVATTTIFGNQKFQLWLSDEIFYDEKSRNFNQNQLRVGIGLPLSKHTVIGTYLMRQTIKKANNIRVINNVLATYVVYKF